LDAHAAHEITLEMQVDNVTHNLSPSHDEEGTESVEGPINTGDEQEEEEQADDSDDEVNEDGEEEEELPKLHHTLDVRATH